jgi:hypothetical protein
MLERDRAGAGVFEVVGAGWPQDRGGVEYRAGVGVQRAGENSVRAFDLGDAERLCERPVEVLVPGGAGYL